MTMFRRRLSQKPSEELLSNFRRQYTGLLPPTEQELPSCTLEAGQTPNLAFDPNHFQGISGRNNGLYTSDSLDIPPEWRTAGLLDPNVDGFRNPNEPGGYWPPTPQGSSLYGGGPTDVHPHQTGFGITTPASASSARHLGFTPNQTHFHGHEFLQSQGLDSMSHTQMFNTSQDLASHALHQPTHTMAPADSHSHGLHLSDVSLAHGFESQQPGQVLRPDPRSDENIGPKFVVDALNRFRFRTVLRASTAMIKHPHDIPVTYLNKSQSYNIQVEDTSVAPGFANPNIKYRTAVRVSFEDEQQRKNPATSWQLWNEGRGTNEAIKRGGKKPKAVEFIHPDQTRPELRNNIQPTVENFDGFSVTWSPNIENVAICNLQLRFNFLSTDFSHSKGVKGVPVRLCAKTEIIEGQNTLPRSPTNREICYCAVKIFRDHGAERKLANDQAHINKLIEKFTSQAEQAEVSTKDNGKRRRSDSVVSARPSKLAKHKRTWSVSSSGSIEDAQETAEDELSVRIRSLKAMPDSIRQASAFYLNGDEQDDLDTYPVVLSTSSPTAGSPARTRPPSLKTDTTQTTSRSTVQLQSETPSSRSPSMMRARGEQSAHQTSGSDATPTPVLPNKSPVKHDQFLSAPQQLASPPSSAALGSRRHDQALTSLPIPQLGQALDVDKTYQAPLELKPRAVAEFFMKPSVAWEQPKNDNYRAIYLMEKSLHELTRAIATKCGVDPSKIICTVRVNEQGLQITAEDDMVEQMPERQGFIAELDVADNTHDSAAQFFEDPHDPASEAESVTQYKLTLRY